MGQIILKADPDRNLYIEWSSVVEAPTFIGTRAEMIDHLTRFTDYLVEQRLARADGTGTSAMYHDPPDGSWEDSGFIVEQRGWLPRADLVRFADAYAVDDLAAAYGLLQPFEDNADDQSGGAA